MSWRINQSNPSLVLLEKQGTNLSELENLSQESMPCPAVFCWQTWADYLTRRLCPDFPMYKIYSWRAIVAPAYGVSGRVNDWSTQATQKTLQVCTVSYTSLRSHAYSSYDVTWETIGWIFFQLLSYQHQNLHFLRRHSITLGRLQRLCCVSGEVGPEDLRIVELKQYGHE